MCVLECKGLIHSAGRRLTTIRELLRSQCFKRAAQVDHSFLAKYVRDNCNGPPFTTAQGKTLQVDAIRR